MTPSESVSCYRKAQKIAGAFREVGVPASDFDQGNVTDEQWTLATQAAGWHDGNVSQETKDLVVHLLRDFEEPFAKLARTSEDDPERALAGSDDGS